MKKIGLCMMCILSLFISCGDDDHERHHDPNWAYKSQVQQENRIVLRQVSDRDFHF